MINKTQIEIIRVVLITIIFIQVRVENVFMLFINLILYMGAMFLNDWCVKSELNTEEKK